MPIEPSVLAQRATSRGPQGELFSLVDGRETDQELKDLIVQLALKCPLGKSHFHCPFRILSGLSCDSLTGTVQTLSREACLSLFEMERECRATHADECQSAKQLPA